MIAEGLSEMFHNKRVLPLTLVLYLITLDGNLTRDVAFTLRRSSNIPSVIPSGLSFKLSMKNN